MTSPDAELDQALIEALTAIIDDLCSEWLAFIARHEGAFTHLRHSQSEGAAPAVHALAMHATHHARAVLTLMRTGHPSIVVMPLVRQVFEAGVTAQWLAQVEDAAVRWGWSGVKRTDRLANRMRNSDSPEMVEVGDMLTAQQERRSYPSPPGGRDAGSFLSILEDLVLDSNQLYIMYSTASEYTHASVRTAEAYASGSLGEQQPLMLQPVPDQPRPDVWLKLAASGLVWAHTAANYTDRERTQRNRLRATARQLGIDPDLHPSQRAHARIARNRAQARS